MDNNKTINVEDISKYRVDYRELLRSTFLTPAGQDLLKEWQKIYVEGDLFGLDHRAADYNIGQRDFVLELKSNLENNNDS